MTIGVKVVEVSSVGLISTVGAMPCEEIDASATVSPEKVGPAL